MILQKSCLISILAFFSSAVLAQNGAEAYNYHKVSITASSITIHGETNVNTFDCDMDMPAQNDSILIGNIWSNKKLEFKGLVLKYRVDQFDCGMRAMNSDFQELLKADKEPYLHLTLKSITLHPHNDAFEELDVDAEAEVYLAGVRKSINIQGGKVYNHSSARLTLKGEKELLMSDFSIEPPTKFFGMVKVTDDISIEFEISMSVSELK